jgi:hypothetical protein
VPVASPSATTPITLGQTLTGVVRLSDLPCEELFDGHDEGPCQRFAITIPTSGTLNVHVTSPGPSWLALRVGSARTTYGVTAVDAAATVQAGSYEFSVALHEAVNGNADQTFELTTSLDSPKAARP